MECLELHRIAWEGFRFTYPYVWPKNVKNGIYLMFERGESGHGGDRIVRIGTHTGDRQLESRLSQHFTMENKNRSIFRKNIGRCYLNREQDPYLPLWELDHTKPGHQERMNSEKERELEASISAYIQANISFALVRVESREERLRLESRIISTVSLCEECGPSEGWLGMESTKEKIRRSGLWQVNELWKTPLSPEDLEKIAANIFR